VIYPKYLEGKQLVQKPVTAWSIYYRWVIVGLAFLSMAFWTGIRTAFAVFYVALLDEFSWSRGDAAGVQSTAYIIYVILAPIAGGIDRPFRS
jgi:polyferredoxin